MKLVKKINKPVTKTAQDKKVKQRFSKQDFVQLLSDANKFPLHMRIAAELFRGGVSGRKFMDTMHIEGNAFSMLILDEMTKFDLSRSYDPERIPPALPQFVRYVPTAKQKELREKEKRGRPTTEEAKAFLKKMLDDCLKRGWKEVDFINNLRDMVDGETKSVKVKADEDDLSEVEEDKIKKERTYYARIGKQWQTFTSQLKAMEAMKADDDKVLGPVDVPEQGAHCHYCRFRLNGLIVTVRSEKEKRHMHNGCYWMNEADRSQITVGMVVLDPITATSYIYLPNKGGWVEKEKDATTLPDGASSEGVSTSSGNNNNATATIPSSPKG
jgi:hypothetical protein